MVVLAKIYRQAQTAKQRKELGLIVTLTLFSMLFWRLPSRAAVLSARYRPLCEPRYSGLFRSYRHVPVGERLCRDAVWGRPAWLVKESVSGNRTVRIWGKFALGLGLMSAGFCYSDPERTLVRRLRTLFNAANGAGTGGDGLCRAVYRPGRHVAKLSA